MWSVGWAGVLFAATQVLAADIESLTSICRDCHGENGISEHSDIPTIAGQAYTVIEDNLLAFRAGERPCTETPYRHGDPSRSPTSMCEIAARFDDREIAALAEYFEALEYLPARQDFDPALAAKGAAVHEQGGCEACHADGGRQTVGIACRLAGQWTPYLAKTFEQIRAGERSGPVVMNQAIVSFAPEEIEALLHFYANRQD